ncbi:hypothetical protein [Pacificimonas flava]|nr:hypothetical protein [Pacificimonas flava]MBB5281445.1 Mg2+ and Co2+ transporter CorA [Pacificimonas flava]
MSSKAEEERLRHKIGNLQHENMVLRRMLQGAASDIDEMIESRCSSEAQQQAGKTSSRIKRALDAMEEDEVSRAAN